jgi:hypothetical protein
MNPLRKYRLKELVKHLYWSLQQLTLASITLASCIVAGNDFVIWSVGNSADRPDPAIDIDLVKGIIALMIGVIAAVVYIYRKKRALEIHRGEG